MSQLLSLLERIEQGTGPSLGFGPGRSGRLPGMALIARCSGDLPVAVAAAREAADALVIVTPDSTPASRPEDLDGCIWGAGGVPLQPGVIGAWHDAGADFAISPLAGAVVDAIDIAQPALLHGIRIPDNADDDTWRILAGIPVQALVTDRSGRSGPWQLTELGQVADCARRTDKHLFVRVSEAPSANELLALRQAGALAIVVEANALGADGMAALKNDLLAMSRPQPAIRRRGSPLPGSGDGTAS